MITLKITEPTNVATIVTKIYRLCSLLQDVLVMCVEATARQLHAQSLTAAKEILVHF